MVTVLHEVYFGREPVEDMFNQLVKIREKFINLPFNMNFSIDPEVIKFNRIVEKTFGLVSYSLTIEKDVLWNAYTLPVETFMTSEEVAKLRKALLSSPTGFKFNKNMARLSTITIMTSGIFYSKEITNEELMAVLLHEIGHSFFEAVVYGGICDSGKGILSVINKVNEIIKEKMKNREDVSDTEVSFIMDNLSLKIRNIKNSIIRLVSRKRRGIIKESMEDNLRNRNRIGYTNEKFADMFASMYGFGPYNQTFLLKVENVQVNDYYKFSGVKTPGIIGTFIKVQTKYISDALLYIANIADVHPNTLARCKTQIEYLKKEVAKESIDPKLKLILIAQIDELNKAIEEYVNFPKDEDSMRIQRLFYSKLYEKFGGDRREQDTDNNALFDLVDNRYTNAPHEAAHLLRSMNEAMEYVSEALGAMAAIGLGTAAGAALGAGAALSPGMKNPKKEAEKNHEITMALNPILSKHLEGTITNVENTLRKVIEDDAISYLSTSTAINKDSVKKRKGKFVFDGKIATISIGNIIAKFGISKDADHYKQGEGFILDANVENENEALKHLKERYAKVVREVNIVNGKIGANTKDNLHLYVSNGKDGSDNIVSTKSGSYGSASIVAPTAYVMLNIVFNDEDQMYDTDDATKSVKKMQRVKVKDSDMEDDD